MDASTLPRTTRYHKTMRKISPEDRAQRQPPRRTHRASQDLARQLCSRRECFQFALANSPNRLILRVLNPKHGNWHEHELYRDPGTGCVTCDCPAQSVCYHVYLLFDCGGFDSIRFRLVNPVPVETPPERSARLSRDIERDFPS